MRIDGLSEIKESMSGHKSGESRAKRFCSKVLTPFGLIVC